MWDERYAEPGFAYGTAPNDFLVDHAGQIPPGRVLCLAEGEGRNAVYLAGLGYEVDAVDASSVGLEKATRLAAAANVVISTTVADLAKYEIEPGAYSGIVSIFCHVPIEIRRDLHAQVVRGLVPGGHFLLEAYRKGQLTRSTGGPPVESLLASREDIVAELAGLEILRADDIERDVVEGRFHTGTAAVVQVVARAPV